MSDLVQKLRKAAKFGGHYAEAADEIERLMAIEAAARSTDLGSSEWANRLEIALAVKIND